MFFVVQKVIWFLLLPPASLLILAGIGFVLARRCRTCGRLLILLSFALLYALSLAHVADFIIRPLEAAYPPVKPSTSADAVVVPGGGSIDLGWLGAEPQPNAGTYTRLLKGVELAKTLHVPLILCGGNGEPFSTDLKDADVMAAAALRMGLPSRQLIIENQSRNTLENSYAVRKLTKGNTIILATSAYYMRRAVALFQRRGFTVVAAPVYFLAQARRFNLVSLIPGALALHCSSVAIAEWISMAWWHARGEI